MAKTQIFKTYNQITKLFDVMIMTKQQINKTKNQHFLVLTPKKDVVIPPRRTRKTKQPTLRELIVDLRNDFEKIVKLNNLKTE